MPILFSDISFLVKKCYNSEEKQQNMFYNIKNHISLYCVFHGIRFKVNNEDWLS
jgi:hypothetical protein